MRTGYFVLEDLVWRPDTFIAEYPEANPEGDDPQTTELRALGLQPMESATNFLCVPTPQATAIAAKLREKGISVRAFQKLPGIGDALRITAAPWNIMQTVVDAVRQMTV